MLWQLSALGIASIDAVGIAAMPLLLHEKHGATKAFAFLAGSFLTLFVLGVLFTTGLGHFFSRWTSTHPQIESIMQLLSGLGLLATAGYIAWRARSGSDSDPPSAVLRKRVMLGTRRTLMFGVGLTAVQSVIDFVFLIAMVNASSKGLALWQLAICVSGYAIGALIVQIAILAVYWIAPNERREAVVMAIMDWVTPREVPIAIVISLLVGIAFTLSGLSPFVGGPDFSLA